MVIRFINAEIVFTRQFFVFGKIPVKFRKLNSELFDVY